MSIITDEMVVAFINGIMRTGKRANIHTDAIRAGIAAVAPEIAKAEREACATEADGAGQGRAGTVIAAAIRARSTEDTTP